MSAYVHPSAIVEAGVHLGEGTSVWDNVHIRRNTIIGSHCIIGEKTHVSYDVVIGNLVKINAFVYICTGVTIEDGAMISAGCIFTNDQYPRATDVNLAALRSSDPDEHTRQTRVCAGATIGAGCVIGSDLTIGRWAMIGMGSVVTRSIPDFALAVGNPARCVGYVCRCGQRLAASEEISMRCHRCGDFYVSDGEKVINVSQAPEAVSVS